ncbi:MAG: hypothetical protein HXY22_01840 [Alphaproteobacteria bacterium]|nr:hypothetical protein [Alphaproteobacteria bacterium]
MRYLIAALAVVLFSSGAHAIEAIGCDAPPREVFRNPFPVELTFINRTDQELRIVAGENARGYAGDETSYLIWPGQSVVFETIARAQWFIRNNADDCLEQVVSYGDDSFGISMTVPKSGSTAQRQAQSPGLCDENPGACVLGLFLGIAAVGIMTSAIDGGGNSASTEPVCREQYIGRDSLGQPLYITRCD